MSNLSCLELFAGAGGLATGIHLSGVRHQAFIEWNKDACRTLAANYCPSLVHNTDIREFDFSQFSDVDMIAGGPPCQPFSLGGKHRGSQDKRDLFPLAIKAISVCAPKVFVFENVKGILRKTFSRYFRYVLLRLTYPEEAIKNGDGWETHLDKLEDLNGLDRYGQLKYKVSFQLVNAADYGIPQQRERVFIVGIREDLNLNWTFPEKTHSLDSLIWSQFVSDDYWIRNDARPPSVEDLENTLQRKVNRIKQQPNLFPPSLRPWRTVRDQIGKLPEPNKEGTYTAEHTLREGAKIYPGHTGSYIDLPSKTLKAGDHGVPGGENMIRYSDGSVRYYTTYEAKRIQTFPESYQISGSWSESMRQIGNAVPVALGQCISKSLVDALSAVQVQTNLTRQTVRQRLSVQ